MIKPNLIKNKLLATIKSIIYRMPNIYSTYSPIKIYEFKELIRDINILKTDKILDIGCGEGLHAIILGKKAKKTYGIDINEKRIIKARHRATYMRKRDNIKFRCIKLEYARFEIESFDKIFSISVLEEHIPNYFDVLEETYKILKKGGQLIFSY